MGVPHTAGETGWTKQPTEECLVFWKSDSIVSHACVSDSRDEIPVDRHSGSRTVIPYEHMSMNLREFKVHLPVCCPVITMVFASRAHHRCSGEATEMTQPASASCDSAHSPKSTGDDQGCDQHATRFACPCLCAGLGDAGLDVLLKCGAAFGILVPPAAITVAGGWCNLGWLRRCAAAVSRRPASPTREEVLRGEPLHKLLPAHDRGTGVLVLDEGHSHGRKGGR
mmetsp:Transcript_17934/g.56141  ORF Transcript_17934/g.56141 Transcript_17934/m.56141 type:complete len:225 (-) Transcript_17934:2091-2765(-)